jgi:phosphomannomutase
MGSLRIGLSGLRGQVATALTPPLAMDFASALGTYVDGGVVVVGCDTRISSGMFRHAVVASLLGCGCEVVDAGVLSAPEMHFAVPHLKASAGLIIGGGHHQKGWNTLIPLTGRGTFLNPMQLQELLDVYHARRYARQAWDRIGRARDLPADTQEEYLDRLCAQLDLKAIADRRLTVIADFCNGSGSRLAERFARRLGIRLISINCEISGILPHDPEPRPRSAMQVQSVLKPLGADIGFVFDSSMSRVSIVTSTGETLSEEYTVALVANQILARRPDQKVVTNGCTTRTLDEVALRHRAKVFKTHVGEASVVDHMEEQGAELAGEGSGSVAFRNHIPGYDTFMVMGVILEAMARHSSSSADLASALPRYHIIKGAVRTTSSRAYALLHDLRDSFPSARVNTADGLRFDWPDGWIHLRTSMTEPMIRMIVEWKTKEEAEDRALQARGLIERRVS